MNTRTAARNSSGKKEIAVCGYSAREKEPRMKMRRVTFLSLAGILAVCLPVFAHHGNVAYDESKVVVLKNATVTKFAWANPHSIITFDAKNGKGQVEHWAAELGSPSALTLIGWTKVSVQPGDAIAVYIHQAKTGNPVGRIDHIVLADGSSLRDSSGGGDRGDRPSGAGSKY
jgi:hypothetical protein